MRHCNSVFKPNDIWYLLDKDNFTQRKLFIASCPICGKNMALYSYMDKEKNLFFEKYYYSQGAKNIKQRLKHEVTSTMLGFKTKYKMPFGFKYGINKEIKRFGKVIAQEQYACDFWGNKILVKKITNGEKT